MAEPKTITWCSACKQLFLSLHADEDAAEDRGEVGGYRGDRDHLDREPELQAAG